jgi:lycopene cyclase domain-containing protein
MLGHSTYLVLELAWALPVLLLQWAFGWRYLSASLPVLTLTVAISTVYLSCADSVAIANGIWSLHSDRIVGLRLGNVPVEEGLFFVVTNTMVAQSVVLVSAWRKDVFNLSQPAVLPEHPAFREGRQSKG